MHEGGVFRIWTSHTCITLYIHTTILAQGKMSAPAVRLSIINSDQYTCQCMSTRQKEKTGLDQRPTIHATCTIVTFGVLESWHGQIETINSAR